MASSSLSIPLRKSGSSDTATSPSGKSADIPRQLFGYDILDILGEGAGSWIYAVNDPHSKQIYALKHVKVKNDKQHRYAEQLLNEYEVGKQVSHRLIRKLVDA